MHSKVYGTLDRGVYQTDLVELETQYQPGMKLHSVTAEADWDGELLGIKMKLEQGGDHFLNLSVIGNLVDTTNVSRQDEEFDDWNSVTIVYDMLGVCNVLFNRPGPDGMVNELNANYSNDCYPGSPDPDITATTLAITQDYPLVGLHGSLDDGGIGSLGLIWLDADNPDCQRTLSHAEVQSLQNQSAVDAFKALSTEQINQGLELERSLNMVSKKWPQECFVVSPLHGGDAKGHY